MVTLPPAAVIGVNRRRSPAPAQATPTTGGSPSPAGSAISSVAGRAKRRPSGASSTAPIRSSSSGVPPRSVTGVRVMVSSRARAPGGTVSVSAAPPGAVTASAPPPRPITPVTARPASRRGDAVPKERSQVSPPAASSIPSPHTERRAVNGVRTPPADTVPASRAHVPSKAARSRVRSGRPHAPGRQRAVIVAPLRRARTAGHPLAMATVVRFRLAANVIASGSGADPSTSAPPSTRKRPGGQGVRGRAAASSVVVSEAARAVTRARAARRHAMERTGRAWRASHRRWRRVNRRGPGAFQAVRRNEDLALEPEARAAASPNTDTGGHEISALYA